MKSIEKLIRPNMLNLKPYRSARDEFKGEASVYLDANENPFNLNTLNRYPDPLQKILKMKISEIKNMNWDDFITIATTAYMSREDWDIAIMKYTDLLAKNLRTKNIRIAYSTELSIDIKNKHVISKYDDNHRHIHFFLFRDGNTVDSNQLENTMLNALGKSKFRKWEYFAEPFKNEFYGENYILKTYNKDSDCFSMCAPEPSLVV
jgi:hypothetical protein